MNEMETCPFCRGTGTAFAVDAVTPTGVVNPRQAVCMVCDGAGLVAAERVSEPARTDLDALAREVDEHAFGHVPAESLALAITEARRLAAELEALRRVVMVVDGWFRDPANGHYSGSLPAALRSEGDEPGAAAVEAALRGGR